MARTEYREIICKSALNPVQGMEFRWSLNPYRGCVHRCQYCFARPTHRYFELGIGDDFGGIVFVKANLPEVLDGELAARRWRRELVAVGTATDPYQPIEGRYRLTRRALELLATSRTPVSIVTKGPMIWRDRDILEAMTAGAGATVWFSIPTVNREIWSRTEPGTAPPAKRLQVMGQLVEAGVDAGVIMAPLLPGLSANRVEMEATVRAAAEHGARRIRPIVMHLAPELRDYFFGFLASDYPELLDGYRKLYAGKYAPDVYRERVVQRVAEIKAAAGYGAEPDDEGGRIGPKGVAEEGEQMMLPLLTASDAAAARYGRRRAAS